MKTITLHDIRMESPFAVHRILDIKLHATVNAHAICTLECVVESGEAPLLSQPLQNAPVVLRYDDSILFAGYPLRATKRMRNDAALLDLYCVSSSYLMDIAEQKRSFQDHTMAFGQIAKRSAQMSGIGVVEVFAQDCVTRGTVIQYAETDWAFSLRMAGQLQTVITPNFSNTNPQIAIGFPRGAVYSIPDTQYAVVADNRYTIRPKVRSLHSFRNTITVETNGLCTLGDRVYCDGQEWLVGGMDIHFAQALSNCSYVLGEHTSFQIEPYNNTKLAGATFCGTIIDVRSIMIKVHLDIDPEQPVESACWVDFMPPSCHVLFAMPQTGERVFMEMISDHDNSGIIVNSLRSNIQIVDYAKDPVVHRFQNDFNKRFTHNRNKIQFDTNFKMHRWTLEDPNIEFHSARNIQLNAKTNIIIKALNDVSISAPAQIHLQTATNHSAVELSGNQIQLEAYQILEQSHAAGTVTMQQPAASVEIPEEVINAVTGTRRYV